MEKPLHLDLTHASGCKHPRLRFSKVFEKRQRGSIQHHIHVVSFQEDARKL
jgi:hypothetical protein